MTEIRRFETYKKTMDQNNANIKQEEFYTTDKCSGTLDIIQDSGYGFLRKNMMSVCEQDIYVSPALIKLNSLRVGDFIQGIKKCKLGNDKYDALMSITTVNGEPLEISKKRISFEKLIALFPNEQIKLSTDPNLLSTRIMDMFTPIGKGQRGLIVAPPKSGKTMLLKDIANGITTNHKEIKLIVLLIGERPEEVTDMCRSVKGEVIASTFDETAERQAKISTFALEKAKRLVEKGEDVVILMDSITRLARAYNIITPTSGKILSGGIEMNSLYYPKKFFGAARNTEIPIEHSQEKKEEKEETQKNEETRTRASSASTSRITADEETICNLNEKEKKKINQKEKTTAKAGSLTIIATALVDTGSKMDDVIFEEFKGTGNMELQLDRNLANRRIYPAINVQASSTRREDLLIEKNSLFRIQLLRKILADEPSPISAMENLLRRISNTKNNEDFLFSTN